MENKLKRADYRRLARHDRKGDKMYSFTAKQLEEYVIKASEKRAALCFQENMNHFLMVYTDLFDVANRITMKKLLNSWGPKRQEKYKTILNEELSKINSMIHKSNYDDAELAKWCWLNGIDSEAFFGIKKRMIKTDALLDEEDNPIIILD